MKKITLSALILIFLLTGCGSSKNNGELTGVPGRKKFFEPEPFEMAFIPAGNFMMGPSDQDAVFAMNSISKSVTVDAFWMDQTEITNNKYRQFVYYVRDSIFRTKLGNAGITDREYFMTDKEGNVIEPNVINWNEKIDLEEETTKSLFEEMLYPPEERFNGKKQTDVRKLNYSYFWVINRLQNLTTNRIMPITPVNMRDRLQISTAHAPMLKTVHHLSNTAL
jgi:sulfatase modifying factor 1